MKLTDILKEFEQVHPQAFEEKADRRHILRNLGFKVAKIASPFAIAGLTVNNAAAKTTDILAEAIVFLLNMSYMQSAFYTEALSKTDLIPIGERAAFEKIAKDKKAQVAYWIYHLNRTNNVVPTAPAYDFTGKGALSSTMSDFKTLLTVAHALEDGGVRMYLTGVKMFLTNKAFRIDAMNIATANARHAAHIRFSRRNIGVDMMPWIAGTEANSIVGEIRKHIKTKTILCNSKQTQLALTGLIFLLTLLQKHWTNQ